jgi:hypothetical protein
MSATVRTPDWMCSIARLTAFGGCDSPMRRSSAKSMIEYLKHGSTARGSSFSGRPLSSSVLPLACSAHSACTFSASAAMKAGTSTIRLADGAARSRSCSRPSLATLSDTRAPVAGQTLPTSCSSCPTSSTASERSGNTVNRVALTERLRSMNGEYPSAIWPRMLGSLMSGGHVVRG